MHTNKNLFLVIVLLLFFSLTLSASGKPRIVRKVTPEEASELIRERGTDPDFIILDVRTPDEYAKGHLDSAVNMDYYEDSFRKEIEELDRKKSYLLYCHSGNRSGKTLDLMRELDFREVYDIRGGIRAWRQKDLPLVK